MNPLAKLIAFLERLDRHNLHYTLACVRDAIMVEVFVPGEHWEVEFFADCHVEVEVYKSGGPGTDLEDESALERLFAEEAS
jgi:hypothetical protein